MYFPEREIELIKEGWTYEGEKVYMDVTRKRWGEEPQVRKGRVYMATSDPTMKKDDCDCFIKVKGLFRERLGNMRPWDAVREGHESLEEYKEAWEERYNEEWDPDKLVWVVEFEYVGEEPPE